MSKKTEKNYEGETAFTAAVITRPTKWKSRHRRWLPPPLRYLRAQ